MTNKTTIRDLAEYVGLSIATVSQILNGVDERFKDETVKKVKQAQITLGYIPNFNAQKLNLKQQKVLTLGVLVPDIENAYFSQLIKGIENFAFNNRVIPLFFSSSDDVEKERYYLRELLSRTVDGIIISSPHLDHEFVEDYLKKQNTPFLLLDQSDEVSDDIITIDNYRGGQLAAKAILNQQYNDIGVIFPKTKEQSANIRQRFAGFMDEMKLVKMMPCVFESNLTKQSGYEISKKIIRSDVKVVFVASDEIAIGLYRGLYEHSIKIPNNLAVIGYDNTEMAKYLTPGLTTISQPSYELGQLAAETIIKRINNKALAPQNFLLEPNLVIRKSL